MMMSVLLYLLLVKALSAQGSISGNYGDRSDVLFSSFAVVSNFQKSSFSTPLLQTTSKTIQISSVHIQQVSESSLRWLTSANDYDSFKPYPMCECDCRYAKRLKNAGKLGHNNVTSAKEIKLQIDKLQKELSVNLEKLSATKRKKSSASDDRPSAKSAGIVGVGILVLIVGGLFLLDLTTIKQDVGLLRENLCFFWKKTTKH